MRHKSDDITAPPGEVGFGWNEIQFLEADKLRKMAPSIVGLEIRRLTQSCAWTEPGSDLYNTIVKARYELRMFLERLEESEDTDVQRRCAPHLESALISLSMGIAESEGEMAEVLAYVADRMTHVLERVKLVY